MAAFTPAAFKQRADYNFVASYAVHKPEVDNVLTKRYGSQTLTGLLDMLGMSKGVSALEYSHFEEDRLMPKIKATSAGAGAGAVATFTIHASAIKGVDQDQSPYVGTPVVNSINPVRINDVIMIKNGVSSNGYVKALVLSVNDGAGTFTAQPIDSDSIPAIAVADEIIIIGNAHGEGSNQPRSLSTQVVEYKNRLQIVKHNYQITGSENDVILWFETKDPKTGKKGYTWGIKGEADTYAQFLNQRELALLLSEKITNNSLADTYATANEPIQMTDGLIPFCQGGINLDYNQITGITLEDFETLIVELDKQKGSKENLLMCGIELSLGLDKILGDRFAEGAISYGMFKGKEDKMVDMQFSNFKIGNYMFHKKTYDPFNDLQTLGADGFAFPFEGMILPMDSQVDAKSREKVQSLRKRYLVNPDSGASREFKVAYWDGFSQDSNGKDVMEVRYLSHCGFEGFAQNRFGYIKKA